jgi:Fic-DOC domain mobile mystery protein B
MPEDDGNTPLDADDIAALIPDHIQERGELNQWEARNISAAEEWAYGRTRFDALSVKSLKELHRRMFDRTWTWAGTFRQSENSISPYRWTEVPSMMEDSVENTRTQHEASDKAPPALDEIAARYHHALVRVHPWPNGNGRHARLATDLLLREWGRPAFTWGGGTDLTAKTEARGRYLVALRAADGGDFEALKQFVRT